MNDTLCVCMIQTHMFNRQEVYKQIQLTKLMVLHLQGPRLISQIGEYDDEEDDDLDYDDKEEEEDNNDDNNDEKEEEEEDN